MKCNPDVIIITRSSQNRAVRRYVAAQKYKVARRLVPTIFRETLKEHRLF